MVLTIIAILVAIIGIFGVVVLVVAASDLSGRRRPSRSATLATVGCGLFMLLVGSLQISHSHSRVKAKQPMHLKHGVFEPWQAYGAWSGVLLAGISLIATGAYRWNRACDTSRGEPTI